MADTRVDSLLARVAGGLSLLLGVLVLVGWAAHVDLLKSVVSGAVQMKANTAVGLVLAGICLCLQSGSGPTDRRRPALALALALLVAVLGAATLGEYEFGWRLGIDELLVRDTANAYNAIPGRMSPYSAVAFLALGLALATLRLPRCRAVVWVASTLVLVIGGISLIGYAWNASELVTDSVVPPVAVHTAFAFACLGIGTLLANRAHAKSRQAIAPERSRASIEMTVAAGFVGIFVLLVLGGGVIYRTNAEFARSARTAATAGLQSGRQNALLVLLLTLLCTVGIFCFLLYSIRREMLARARTDTLLRQLNAELERRVQERTAELEANQRLVVVAAERDTAEREKMNEALRASVELYRQTLDHMLEGCQIVGRDWRYRYVNAAAVRQNRQSEEALRGRTMMEAFPGIERTEVFAMIRRCMEERVAGHMDVDFEFPDGSRGWFQVSVQPTPEGVAIFSVDITERKRGEEAIRAVNADLERHVAERTAELVTARQAADAANLAKSAFLATMSHEIRTPMNGVVGMVEVLCYSQLPPHQAEAVRTIRASAFSLLGIIDDILDFSKIEAGRLELERMPVALPELIESVCDTLLPLAIDKDVELNMFIAPGIPHLVWSDATRVRQVLFNLAGNAIKFGAGQPDCRGRVSIRAELTAEQPPRLALEFADNGIGMTPDALDHLFSSFTQAEVSTTRRFGGTGLGLAICKRLVDLMRGEIHVRTAVGQGSTFIVTLPLEAVEAVEGAAADTAFPDRQVQGLDCIVVGRDSHADDLRVYLEHAGARVHAEPDLDAAAAHAARLGRVVVVQNTHRFDAPARGTGPVPFRLEEGPAESSLDALHAAFAANPDARHVLIARGCGRRARMATTDVVRLDGNCLRRSSLLRAVAIAAGLASPEVPHDAAAAQEKFVASQAPTHAQARAENRLILIAEDDEVNQNVILRQIEVLGHAAELADNGAEALRLWREGHYALLLTDLHMPDMDGYTLAETIRREETLRGVDDARRIPILALTANALRGEAMRARRAGMDEYLTKPLQLHLLKEALAKWMPPPSAPALAGSTSDKTAAPDSAPPSGSAPAVDLQALQALIGGDFQAARQILADYCVSSGRQAEALRSAHEAGDLRRIGAIAHQLKSASRSVGAFPLGDACGELENACRIGIRQDVANGMLRFEAALMAVEVQTAHLLTRA